jgi:hypothetical protein
MEKDLEPYRPSEPATSLRPPSDSRSECSALVVVLLSTLPPALSVCGALAVLGSTPSYIATRFFLFGGHALVLLLMWCILHAYLLPQAEERSVLAIKSVSAIASLLAAFISWLVVAVVVLLDAAWWP